MHTTIHKRGAWKLASFGLVVLALAVTGTALAGPSASKPAIPPKAFGLAFDRGLPSKNLNNAAGALRSNVAWAVGNDYVTGDDFTIGKPGQRWVITKIRVWNPTGHVTNSAYKIGDDYSNLSLYLGAASPGAIRLVASGTLAVHGSTTSNPYIIGTRVYYANPVEKNYQGNSNSYQLWQIDFGFGQSRMMISGGVKYNFAVDGTPRDLTNYWFNHASNAALSGSTQTGADDRFLAWPKGALGSPPIQCDSSANGGPSACDGGWDKTSDINVQVFANRIS